MLDTKTLTEETIKTCRETEEWFKKFVDTHAPEGTTFSCEELWVNDVEGDEYIFCEVVLTCNKRKHCFNFYAGTAGASVCERLGGKKGEIADGDKFGKSFEMEFCIPSKDDMEDLAEFLEGLDKYVPKMPKPAKKKAKKHIYLLTSYSYGDNIDRDLVPVVVMAQGDSLDDLIPAISDDVAATLAMDDIKSVEIEDLDGNKIEPYVCSVCEALFGGATTILVKQTYIADGSTRTDVYTINELD